MTEPRCPVDIEFGDVQGGTSSPLMAGSAFPFGRFGLISVSDPKDGRAFVEALRHRITTAVRWPSHGMDFAVGRREVPRPKVTLNLAFTYRGPARARACRPGRCAACPTSIMDGMAARCDDPRRQYRREQPQAWDPVWDAREQGARTSTSS